MKKIIAGLVAIMSVSLVYGQEKVSSRHIFEMINQKKAVIIKDAVIEGDLDLTELSNKRDVSKGSDNQSFKSTVEVPLTFINCTFKGKVVAYKSLENDSKTRKSGGVTINWGNNILYTADFDKAITFDNCTFRDDAEFKYSKFEETVNFEGSRFEGHANFKYGDFQQKTTFRSCYFAMDANFKYAQFDQDVSYSKNEFAGFADFKYANFGDRVSFKGADFRNNAIFKYTKTRNEAIFVDARFRGTSDFKYFSGKRYM